jgi:DNA replication protein DnaC
MSRPNKWAHLEGDQIDFPEERWRPSPELEKLLHWQDIRPTTELQAELAAIEAEVNAGGVDRWPDRAMRNRKRLEYAQKRLAEGQERDARQADLPPGCMCSGAGGRHVLFTRHVWVFREYCSCDVGQALKAKHSQEASLARAAAEERRRAQELENFLECQVPLHFRRITANRFPATTATQRAAVTTAGKWALTPDDELEHPWLLFRGPPGRGKTSMAIHVARTRIQNGLSSDAILTSVPDLLLRIKATFDKDTRGERDSDVMNELAAADLLILDDLGAENTTEWSVERLFTLLNRRHGELLATIITTNLGPELMAKRLGERLAWRVVEMSEIVSLEKCPNLRAQPSRPALEVVNA